MSNSSFQNSAGKSKISRRWKVDIKETVNDFDFSLIQHHRNGGKCEFCGNNLQYVAVIEGHKIPDNSVAKVYSVGFDCLELVFGRDWKDHRVAKDAVKKMKEEAKAERRVEENKKKYADILTWYDNQSEKMIENDRVFSDMRKVLTTGYRDFTPGMESWLRQKMSEVKYTKDEYERKLAHFETVTLPKIENVLNLVKKVDNITNPYNAPSYSAFDFVRDVHSQALVRKTLSLKQLKALEKIYKLYSNQASGSVEENEEIQKQIDEVPY